MIIGNVAHVSPQLAQRRVLIDAYGKYYQNLFNHSSGTPIYSNCSQFDIEGSVNFFSQIILSMSFMSMIIRSCNILFYKKMEF